MSARRVAPERSAAVRRPGRPSRIDRAAIARAAAELPLASLTVRSVADRLGVSVPAVYHYVSGREELMLLAAEASAARIPLPEDHGQHWAIWLFEWADYVRRAFVAEPQVLMQFIDGALGLDVMVEHIDAAIGLCVRQGFSEREALDAYYLVSEVAIGAAGSEIRERAAAEKGRPVEAEYLRLLARRPPEDLPHLRRLIHADIGAAPKFVQEVTTALVGIAARRGDAWQQVVVLVEEHVTSSSGST